MTIYDRGSVVLVDIAFSGSVGSKRRPAVVISTNQFNVAGSKRIVAAITSNVTPPLRPGDTLLAPWQAAGLMKPSAVRGVLASVDIKDVVRTLGMLAPGDMAPVDQGVSGILGYSMASA